MFYSATYTSESDEKLCYELGADKFLRKPASSETIVAALKDVMRSERRAPAPPRLDDLGTLKQYSERLVGKLEDKNIELAGVVERLAASEAKLQQSEQQLRLMVQHSPAAIAMLDRDMRYVVASRRWHLDYRLGDRDLTGRSHYEVFPEIPAGWKEIHRRCLAGDTEQCDAESFRRQDGTVDWLSWEICPWRDAHGAVGGLIIFSEVITQRHDLQVKLRASEEHFRLLFEQSADGIAVVASDLTYVRLNASGAAMLRGTPEDFIGRNAVLFLAPHERPRVAAELAHLRAGQPYRRQWEMVRKDGSIFTGEISATGLDDGGLILTVRDVTERVAVEQARDTRAKELEEFHRLSVGRELQMIELKKEVNALARQAGKAPPYDLAFLDRG
jgi:PAS domain S-box-containing protein